MRKLEGARLDAVHAGVELLCQTPVRPVQRMAVDPGGTVLGGGLVAGTVVLLGGEPGAGKSTLALTWAAQLAHRGPVLYVSGEETAEQIRLRADRVLGHPLPPKLYVYCHHLLPHVLAQMEALRPILTIVDSVQTVLPRPGSGGGAMDAYEVGLHLTQAARRLNCVVILLCQLTKKGHLAGARGLEHIVDVVLRLEGQNGHRRLTSTKNRYGTPTSEALVVTGTGFQSQKN